MPPAENAVLDLPAVIEQRRGLGGYPFRMLHEISAIPRKRWLIKGVFAAGETSAWIGPPGSLKSALLAEAAFAICTGEEWHGRKNAGQSGVLYFALERSDLVNRRLSAHRDRAGLAASDRLPIGVVAEMINLMDPAAVSRVVATI